MSRCIVFTEGDIILLALDSIPSYSSWAISRDCGAIRQYLTRSVFWETSSHPGYRYPARGSGVVVVVFG